MDDVLPGGGEMGARIRAFDWSLTPLGPLAQWPRSLRMAARLMIESRYPMYIWWGRDLINLYNDAYRPVLGHRHPVALGKSATEVWSEIWDTIGPQVDGVMNDRVASWNDEHSFVLTRNGYPEETYFTFSHSPLFDEHGVAGLLCVNLEQTQRVLAQRRATALKELAAHDAKAPSEQQACKAVARILDSYGRDVSFAMIYVADAQRSTARLIACTANVARSRAAPVRIPLDASETTWPLAEVARTGQAIVFENLTSRWELPGGAWPEPTHTAVVLPLVTGGEHTTGFVIAGVSPRRVLDDDYRVFFDLLANQIGNALVQARAYEQERKRAESLAELDRAKTTFFSNVSHEFRTPLTLMLGPIEDLLAKAPADDRETLEVVHRNAQRLQKLVNTLLDFSRIEAGRVRASYEPTDLAVLTSELASGFRSSCEQAGLRLEIICPPLPSLVHVDREMWEQVVLNLMSNAFKHTFEGGIEVTLEPRGAHAVLAVSDTGVGIRLEELPHIFERFHRVKGVRSRSFEGTGIGLSLVQELVKLHGGTITVTSQENEGSTFTVSVPFGTAHLPADRIQARPPDERTSRIAMHLDEARSWLPSKRRTPVLASDRPTILWADDNADMREYVSRLLAARWNVVSADNGAAALAAARERRPDLVLADVMMPVLDGFDLVAALRGDPHTATVPIILLSARAGEESRVEGLASGADEYLVKPFSARELVARVESHLELAQIRREAHARQQSLKDMLVDVLESMPDAFAYYDDQWRITYVNAQSERLVGRPREALVGKDLWTEYPVILGTPFEAVLRAAMHDRVPGMCEVYIPERARWYELEARPTAGGIVCYTRDTTERRAAEAIARRLTGERDQLLARLQEQFERLPLAVVVTDPQLKIIDWNPAAERVFGYTREQVIGRVADELILAPKVDTQLARIIAQLSDGHLESHNINENVTKDGRTIVCEWHNSPLRDTEGRLIGSFAMADDITARIEAERRLRSSQSLLAETQRLARMGSWSWDVPTGTLTWSDEQYRLLGLEPDGRVSAQSSAELVHPDDRARVETAMQQALRDHQPFEIAWRALHAGGGIRFMQSRGQVELDDNGRPARVFGSMQDITELALTERALVEIQDDLAAELAGMTRLQEISQRLVESGNGSPLLDEILDAAIAITSADMGMIQLLDGDTGVLRIVASRGFDDAFLTFFKDLAPGQGACGAALRDRARVVVEDIAASSIFTGTSVLDVVSGAGVRAVQATPLVSRSGGIVGVLSTHYRITRRPAERDLKVIDLLARQAADWLERLEVQEERERLLASEREARAEAERAARVKDDFLATLSHELRTPLSAITGWSDIIKMAPHDVARVTQGAEVIGRNARTQSQLVGDLLDLSRIITGKMRLEVQRVELPAVVEAAVESVRPAAEARNIHIHMLLEPITQPVHGDVARLQQIVWNLVSNAAKFTPEGGRVEVVLARVNSQVEISVSDTGQGIAPSFMPHLFERFRQADASAARQHGGLGIGLALVKELAELHGGSVQAYSEGEGRGATFVVQLPLAISRTDAGELRIHPRAPATLAVTDIATPQLAGVRVLVVDDERDGREVIERILLDRQAKVITAAGVEDALAALKLHEFDVLLSDIGLPKRDGYELIAEVRKRGIKTPAAAVTAFARSEDRTRALLAGYQAHLAKPLDAAELLATVASLSGHIGT